MKPAPQISLTRMRTLYATRASLNSEIKEILQVEDNNKEELELIGQAMIEGDQVKIKSLIAEKKVKMILGFPVKETNAVYSLRVGSYYLFSDLKKMYE